MTSCVHLYRSAGLWRAEMPDGSLIDTSTSTSQGLQEAINAAHANGLSFHGIGGPEVGNTDPNQITTTQTIKIPPGAKGVYRLEGISLWCNVPADTDGIDIAANDMLDFDFGGQIIYPGNNSAVGLYVGGSYNEGNTTFTAFTSSRLRFMSIVLTDRSLAVQHTHGTGLSINPSGPFTYNYVEVNEINGGQTPWIVYGGPGPTTGSTYNIRGIH